MDDKEIIDLYRKRDEQAIKETINKYGRYCFSIARNILSAEEDAEECVSDALLNTWNSIPPHSPKVLPAFVGSLTRCAALKKWRDKRALKRGGGEIALVYEELSECLPDGSDVQLCVEANDLSDRINRFILALPDAERRVFVCRYWYCDSIDSIAERFDFSCSKVKSMLYRARGKLYILLKKEGVLE